MRPLKNLMRLMRELFGFARENKAWWMIPVVVVLLLIALIIVAVSTISPFVYPLF